MNYYPEQLEQIAKLCRTLNEVDNGDGDGRVTLKNRIPVLDAVDESETPIGYLIDEIGGAWSFEPAGGAA